MQIIKFKHPLANEGILTFPMSTFQRNAIEETCVHIFMYAVTLFYYVFRTINKFGKYQTN